MVCLTHFWVGKSCEIHPCGGGGFFFLLIVKVCPEWMFSAALSVLEAVVIFSNLVVVCQDGYLIPHCSVIPPPSVCLKLIHSKVYCLFPLLPQNFFPLLYLFSSLRIPSHFWKCLFSKQVTANQQEVISVLVGLFVCFQRNQCAYGRCKNLRKEVLFPVVLALVLSSTDLFFNWLSSSYQ